MNLAGSASEAMIEQSLDLRQLLVGDINRLRYVKRFSTALVLHTETTAEHCFYVTLYTLFICRWLERNATHDSPKLDVSSAVLKALLHDLDECRTGDIIRSFKHVTPEFSKQVETISGVLLKQTLKDVFRNQEGLVKDVFYHWQTAKDVNSFEGRVVSFADWLSVISHMWQEVHCSNASMLVHQETTMAYGEQFKDERYAFLQPLVDQALALMNEIFVDMRPRYMGAP